MNRLARRAILLLVAAMILPTAITVLAPVLTKSLRSHLPAHPGIVADIMSAVVGILFCAGLAVRAFARTRNDRDEQRARLAVRRPVEDDAADAADEDPDEDPLVPWNGE